MGVESPGLQGTRRENTVSIRPTSNAARREESAPGSHGYSGKALRWRHDPQGADREPGRDRRPDHPDLPGDGDQDGRRLFDRGQGRDARPDGGPGRLHRPAARRGQLPERPGDPLRDRDHRCGRRASRLRLPRRERRLRGDLRQLRRPVHRALLRGDPPDGGQDRGAARGAEGQGAGRAWERRGGHRGGRGASGLQGDRFPRDRQGGGRAAEAGG